MKKILIIDDNEAILRSVSYALKAAGYDVMETSDPLKGIHEANTDAYDLVLLDVIMPDYSGYDVMEKINVNADNEKTPVIIFSNLDRAEDKELAKQMGAVGLISKSDMNNEKLVHIVDKFFAKN